MIRCAICDQEYTDIRSLGKHLFHSHKDISKKDYYDQYIKEVSSTCVCGTEKKFRGLGEGYRTFCSVKCRSDNTKSAKYWLGKKQPQEMIEKRIANTDQSSKERTRKETMIERYGVSNAALVPEFLEKIMVNHQGWPKNRTTEHQQKIIDSKRKNGTLSHTKSTRKKISESLNKYYQEGDDQVVTVTRKPANGRGHKVGYIDGIMFRSSYEELFIMFCKRNDIEIKCCENKEHRVRYEYEGKKRWYYPDFYLPNIDICVEIKPKSMLNSLTEAKVNAAKKQYNTFLVLTEDELLNEEYLLLTFSS